MLDGQFREGAAGVGQGGDHPGSLGREEGDQAEALQPQHRDPLAADAVAAVEDLEQGPQQGRVVGGFGSAQVPGATDHLIQVGGPVAVGHHEGVGRGAGGDETFLPAAVMGGCRAGPHPAQPVAGVVGEGQFEGVDERIEQRGNVLGQADLLQGGRDELPHPVLAAGRESFHHAGPRRFVPHQQLHGPLAQGGGHLRGCGVQEGGKQDVAVLEIEGRLAA